MRCHQWQAQVAGQISRLLNDGLLLRLTVALHLKIEGTGENRLPGFGALTRLIKIAVDQGLADIAQMRPGERNQPIAAEFAEPFATNLGALAAAFGQIGFGQQLAQLLVTSPVACQQEQAAGIVRRLRIGDPDIGPGNRLDALAACAGVELYEAEQVAEIGQRQRGMPSPAARLTASPTRTMPSVTEYSECRRRWT